MKIERQKLLSLLQNMQVNAGKLNYGTLNQVYFKDNIIYQFDNDILIHNEFFSEKVSESFSLPLASLVILLTKLQDSEVELIIEDVIKIKSKKTEIEFTKQEIEKEFEFESNFNWSDLPENFIKGIQFTRKIIDSDNERFTSAIFIDNNKLVSTDGKALSIYNLGVDFNKFFLKQLQIDLLLKFNVKKYCIIDSLIYFLGEDNSIIYFTYLTNIDFPDYKKIQMEHEQEIKFLDKLNVSDIDVNISILEYKNKMLKIEIEKNNIIVKSNNIGINIKTKLDKENEIDNIKFGLDADYLISFLTFDYGSEFIATIDKSKICFENDKIKYITMLLED